MISPATNVLNLAVFTTTGRYLGQVVGVEVDSSGRNIVAYQVAAKVPVIRLWRRRLIIGVEQVVSLTKQALIVEETIDRAASRVPKSETGLVTEPTS